MGAPGPTLEARSNSNESISKQEEHLFVEQQRLDGATQVGVVVVQTGEGQTLGILGSTPQVRDNGLISIQLFVKAGTGTKELTQHIDNLIAIYEHTRFDGILAYTATVTNAPNDQGWRQVNITIPFRRVRNV